MRLALTLLLLTACATGGIRPSPRAGDAGTKLVTEVVEAVHADWWRASKWYRPFDDVTTPARIYISGEWACIMGFPPVHEPREREFYTCPTGWRPSHG